MTRHSLMLLRFAKIFGALGLLSVIACSGSNTRPGSQSEEGETPEDPDESSSADNDSRAGSSNSKQAGSAGSSKGTGGAKTGSGGSAGTSEEEEGYSGKDYGCLIVPSDQGWIDANSNDAGVQGAVYTYADKGGSTITPKPESGFENDGDGRLCIKGKALAVKDEEYSLYWGAAMGIDLCHAGENDDDPDAKYTLSNCPTAAKDLVGVRFQITGDTIPAEIRVIFHETNDGSSRDESTYVPGSSGQNSAIFENGTVAYSSSAPDVNVADIDAIAIQVSSDSTGKADRDFDFCIEHIEALTKDGACKDGAGGESTGPMVTSSDFMKTYEQWKKEYVKSCAADNSYVDMGSGVAVSEGIGYGMLLAAAADDEATFKLLWKFYQNHKGSSGLMDWKISNCNTVTGSGPAADADIDVATALVQASCAFNSSTYKSTAATLLGTIWSVYNGAQGRLAPGNGMDPNCVNPSYLAPGAYRIFAKVDSGHDWNKLATGVYTILGKVADSTTHLVPDWANANGGKRPSKCGDEDKHGDQYYYDAARTPWRIATDYLWWKNSSAKSFLEPLVAWLKKQDGGIGGTGQLYDLDGTCADCSYHSPVFSGAFATAAVVSDDATQAQFYQDLKGTPGNDYFSSTLHALYMAFAAGTFEKCVE